MGKASITIAVGALWNGSATLDKVTGSLQRMERLASQSSESTTQALALQGQEWHNLGTSIYDTGTAISEFGTKLTKSVTVPMSIVGGYAVAQATSFDTSLANLNKTANLTADELEEFGQAALEASKTSPVTAQEILDAEALGAQLGISSEYLQQFAETANGLDIATNMDMETAATQMAQFANIVGMADDETENYGSTIVDLGNNLATTESDISNMALRLAGTSTAAKLSSADILGMAGAMSSLGIKAEAGGTAMTTIISNISTAVAEGGDQVEEYARVAGTSAEEFAQKWQDKPIEAMEMLIEGASDLVDSGQDVNTVLSELGVSGIRQTDVMRRLIGQSDTLRDAVDRANTAWEQNTALSTEVEKRNQSLESRFQTLQNKVNAAATEVGGVLAEALLDAADSLSPVIEAVGDAATAFSEMSPSAQSAVTTLLGVTAAAGPVVTVAGKLVQGVGNVATAFGNVKSEAAVFKDALNTTDGSLMRVYASSKSAASTVGTFGNEAAKAAGGADKYVASWEKMVDSAKTANGAIKNYNSTMDQVASNNRELTSLNDQLNTAIGRNKTQIEKSITALEKQNKSLLSSANAYDEVATKAQAEYVENAKAVSQWSNSTKEAEKAVKGLDNMQESLGEVQAGFVSSGKGASTFAKAASGVGTALAGFAKAAALSAGVMALGAAVAYVAEQVMEWYDHQQLMSTATQSMGDIMAAASSSASGLGDAIGSIDYKAEETTQKLADLNTSVTDTFTEYKTSSAMLDQYTAVIGELGNKSGLTAIEQFRLQQAVEGYNDVCGTSYEVTDAANGKIRDTANDCEVSTDKLLENAEAWRKKAEAEAYASVATQYLEVEAEALVKLNQAQSQLTEEKRRYNELEEKRSTSGLTDEEIIEFNNLRNSIKETSATLEELSADYQAAGANAQAATNLASIAASGLSDTVKNTLSSLPSTMQTTGVEIANSLSAGISEGTVSVEAAEQYITDSVANTVGQMPTQMQPIGMLAAQALGEGIASGTTSVEQANAALSAVATGDLQSMKDAFSAAGVEMPTALSDAITSNAALPSGSVDYMTSLVALKLTGGDLAQAASICGGNIDQGLADAITNGTLAEDAASYLGQDVIAKLNEGAGCHSPSVKAKETGSNVDQGLANGISENQGTATTAAASLGNAVTGALSGISAIITGNGRSASSGFANGIGSGVGATSANASKLNSAAQQAKVTGSYGWGSDLASNFASGIRAGLGWVSSAATAIANAAKSVLHFSAPDKGPWSGAEKGGVRSGLHLAQNFAEGMRSGIPEVSRAATSLAQAMDPTASIATSSYVPLGAGQGTANVGSTTVNTYNVTIDGTRVSNAGPRAIDALSVLFDEFGLVADMA